MGVELLARPSASWPGGFPSRSGAAPEGRIIHKKISGCFQSDDGARAFATVRSYLATARKHNVGALDILAQLSRGEAWMPPVTT